MILLIFPKYKNFLAIWDCGSASLKPLIYNMQDTKYPPPRLSTIQPKKATHNIKPYMVLHGIKTDLLHNFNMTFTLTQSVSPKPYTHISFLVLFVLT